MGQQPTLRRSRPAALGDISGLLVRGSGFQHANSTLICAAWNVRLTARRLRFYEDIWRAHSLLKFLLVLHSHSFGYSCKPPRLISNLYP